MTSIVATLVVLAGCGEGSVSFVDDPETAHLVRGVIDGERFVLRHAATMRMHRGHYRFALLLADVEADRYVEQLYVPTLLDVWISLPLEIGTWSIDDPAVKGGSMSRIEDQVGIHLPAEEGWASVDDIRLPWEDGEAWVSGALELRARDGSWVAGRFEEVPLCYSEP